jgi:MFS family permease
VFFAALAQAAAMSGFGVVVAALAIAAERVTGSKALGTFALALEFAARACAAVPAARAAARRGRRPVLLLGSLCGSLGSLLVAADLTIKSYVVGVVGVVAIGVANAVAQQARFVAAEAVSASDKKRALAVCVAGGAVAAFAGPELAKVSRTWLSNAEYGGCFVAMAACYFFFGVFVVFCRSAGTVNDVFVNAPWRECEHRRRTRVERRFPDVIIFVISERAERHGVRRLRVAFDVLNNVRRAAGDDGPERRAGSASTTPPTRFSSICSRCSRPASWARATW